MRQRRQDEEARAALCDPAARQQRGIIPDGATRAHVGKAVGEFVNEIVYLDRVGFWLARKPWPAAGYRPAMRNRAA
jgi:hypothetical protein